VDIQLGSTIDCGSNVYFLRCSPTAWLSWAARPSCNCLHLRMVTVGWLRACSIMAFSLSRSWAVVSGWQQTGLHRRSQPQQASPLHERVKSHGWIPCKAVKIFRSGSLLCALNWTMNGARPAADTGNVNYYSSNYHQHRPKPEAGKRWRHLHTRMPLKRSWLPQNAAEPQSLPAYIRHSICSSREGETQVGTYR